MGEVVQFERQEAKEEIVRYVCSDCDCSRFNIYTNGSVWCVECGEEMGNLRASENA